MKRNPAGWLRRLLFLTKDLIVHALSGTTGVKFQNSAYTSPAFDAVHQLPHCQLRVADHRLARALQQSGVAALRPGNCSFDCLSARFGDAGQQNLGQAVHQREQGLLRSPQCASSSCRTCSILAASLCSELASSSLCPDNACSTAWRMKAVGDEKPRFSVASRMPLSVDSENRIARWAMWVLSMTKGMAESLWDSGNPSNRWRIPTGMRFHGTHPREKYKRCKQKSTKTRSAASQPFMFHYRVFLPEKHVRGGVVRCR